jgi:hypothetical protein
VDDHVGLRLFRGESCSVCGVHPSVWDPALGGHPNALIAVWKHCRVCEIQERALQAGPPNKDIPGYHLVLQRTHHHPNSQ